MAAVRSSGTSAERRLGEILRAPFPGETLESWPDLPLRVLPAERGARGGKS